MKTLVKMMVVMALVVGASASAYACGDDVQASSAGVTDTKPVAQQNVASPEEKAKSDASSAGKNLTPPAGNNEGAN